MTTRPATPAAGSSPELRAVLARFGERARRDEPLGPRTTYRVGGRAAVLVTVESSAELDELAAHLAGVPTMVIGRGSNVLVADDGFDGVAIALGESFSAIDVRGDRVVAGAGAALPVVARRTAAAALSGFEWAVGVPGSIGGAVVMNAGGHGSDMAASLLAAEVRDLRRTRPSAWVPAAELRLGYRSSALHASQVVLRAELQLRRGDRAASEALIADIVAWRRANQPGGANAGSVFTNPPGDSAGRLIDAAGCKGLRHRSASVSTKHANFIQVDPGGRAADVFALMGEIRARVLASGGPLLHPETRLVGFAEPLGAERPPGRGRS